VSFARFTCTCRPRRIFQRDSLARSLFLSLPFATDCNTPLMLVWRRGLADHWHDRWRNVGHLLEPTYLRVSLHRSDFTIGYRSSLSPSALPYSTLVADCWLIVPHPASYASIVQCSLTFDAYSARSHQSLASVANKRTLPNSFASQQGSTASKHEHI
jgi:hypothetical protein